MHSKERCFSKAANHVPVQFRSIAGTKLFLFPSRYKTVPDSRYKTVPDSRYKVVPDHFI